jgi:hypothetical protein
MPQPLTTTPKQKPMNIDELTIAEAAKIAGLFQAQPKPSDHPFKIGKTYLIRTVTMIDTGILKAVYPNELVLTDAAWIADTGRFSDALKKAEFSEVEPFMDGEVIIGRASIIDAVEIKLAPRSRK